VYRGPDHRFSIYRGHARENLGVPSITLVGGRDDHQPANHVRVPDSGLQRDTASQGIAEEVGTLESQVLDQGCDVVRHQLEAERAIDVSRVPMGLEFDRDDLPGLGKEKNFFYPPLDKPAITC
jgi:hypothetical protein